MHDQADAGYAGSPPPRDRHLGMKDFIAHRHCTSLAQRAWRGHFPGSMVVLPERFARPTLRSMLELPVWALLPLLNRCFFSTEVMAADGR